MKIAVLVHASVWGGLETHAVDLVRCFTRAGHQAHLACVTQRTASLFIARGLTLPIRVLRPPDGALSVRAWIHALRELDAEACVFEKGTLHTGTVALDAAARLVFGRAFVTIEQLEPPVLGPRPRHGFSLRGHGLWWYRQRMRGRMRSIFPHRIVCISEAVRHSLASDYGFPRQRLAVIANGVDTERFTPAERASARRHHQIPDDVLVVATACRLIPQKGVDVALRAFATAVQQRPGGRTRFIVAGDGPEKPRLQQLCRELSLCERVQFPGFVTDMAGFVPAVDVFLVPSRIEAQGIIVLEAMASGCDVIASRVGGIPDMISNSRVGTLVAPDDVAAWSVAIDASLRRTANERSVRGANAREHVVRDFSASRQADRILRLFGC
jgi:glycosyltransferase involved in cell wall biosynthesis